MARRRKKTKIKSTKDRLRLSFFRSNTSMYAQVIDDINGVTVLSASSIKEKKNNIESAKNLAQDLSLKLKEKKIEKLVFDRGSYVVKGRIRQFLETLKESGVNV